jgi:ankyrin repeat protein
MLQRLFMYMCASIRKGTAWKEPGRMLNISLRFCLVHNRGAGTVLIVECKQALMETLDGRCCFGSGAVASQGNENKDVPLHLAALANRLAVIKVLLAESAQSKSDVEAQDAQGYTPLHYACGEGHQEVSRYLVKDVGARLDCRNMDGLTPLMCAVQQGHVGIARMLLEQDGAVIEHVNHSRDTALHYATISEAGTKMVDLLLRR